VISAEYATAHLAAAFDQPLVAVVGGGHPELLAPWQRSPRQRWLRHRTACYGCDWQCPFPEPTCIVGVSRDEFSRAIAEACVH
jgi:ADP-heptose:LPS heptosyltransferase